MYLDEHSERLVGSTKLNKYLKNIADDDIKMGQEVNLLVSKETEIGYKVIINQTYGGLIYKNELKDKLVIGQSPTGYIKPLRPDGKIDVSLHHIGYESVSDNEEIGAILFIISCVITLNSFFHASDSFLFRVSSIFCNTISLKALSST